MAFKHCFDYYTIRLRKSKSRSDTTIRDFGPENHDLFNIASNYLFGLDEFTDDTITKTILKKGLPETDVATNTLFGFLGGGNYGMPREIYNRNSRERVYAMEEDDGDVLQFFYLFYIPPNTTTGALIVHKMGKHGIISHLRKGLTSFFHEICPDYTLRIDPVHLNLKTAQEANLKNLEMVIYKKPTQLQTARNRRHAPQRQAVGRFTFDASTKVTLLSRLIQSRNARDLALEQMAQFIQIDNLENFKVDVQAKVEMGGLNKTLKIVKEFQYNTSIDITDSISYEEGRPTKDSLKREALKAIRELRNANVL